MGSTGGGAGASMLDEHLVHRRSPLDAIVDLLAIQDYDLHLFLSTSHHFLRTRGSAEHREWLRYAWKLFSGIEAAYLCVFGAHAS